MVCHFYGWLDEDVWALTFNKLQMYAAQIDPIKRDEYLMQLHIAHNPYSKTPEKLERQLRRSDREPIKVMDENMRRAVEDKLRKRGIIK